MNRLCQVLLMLLCGGCLTVSTTANRTAPDGTVWSGTQRTVAFGGARAKAADQQFILELDGEEVVVKSGNNVEQPETPNTVKDVTALVGALRGAANE